MNANEKKERILWIEILRVLAMCSVILLHITSTAWGYVEVGSTTWSLYNVMRCFVKWGVTVFVMISGMIFLDTKKETGLRELYCKYILRLIKILVFWSLCYTLQPIIKEMITLETIHIEVNWYDTVRKLLLGHYHLWYLYMIIGLYMMTPFLQSIVNDNVKIIYFISLSMIFTIITPIFAHFEALSIVQEFVNMFSVKLVVGYSLYFALGYFWNIVDLKKNTRYMFYLAACVTLILSIFLTAKFSGKHFLVDGTMSIGNFLITNAIFIFFKYEVSRVKINSDCCKYALLELSSLSLGVYVTHVFFVRYFTRIAVLCFVNPFLITTVVFSGVLCTSSVLCLAIKRIPYLKSYV